jgi:hypothetical protein
MLPRTSVRVLPVSIVPTQKKIPRPEAGAVKFPTFGPESKMKRRPSRGTFENDNRVTAFLTGSLRCGRSSRGSNRCSRC